MTAINLKKQEKTTLQLFFVFFTWPVSSSSIYGTLAANDKSKNKTLFTGIRVYLCGIVGITEQQTAFKHAQSAILQSQEFNLRVEHT